MSQPELRNEPRVPVSFRGTLTLGEKSAACHIQNMCSRGFLIRASKELPVGQLVHLTCELYPDRWIECNVQVRHVNRDCLGAKVIEISDEAKSICRRYLQEQIDMRQVALAAVQPVTAP
jgi:hypothetical protein